MAKKDERRKIEESHMKYQSYDLTVWSLELFDTKTGGYVVVDLRRMAHAAKSKNERKKYKEEFEMAMMVYAEDGHKIRHPRLCVAGVER